MQRELCLTDGRHAGGAWINFVGDELNFRLLVVVFLRVHVDCVAAAKGPPFPAFHPLCSHLRRPSGVGGAAPGHC